MHGFCVELWKGREEHRLDPSRMHGLGRLLAGVVAFPVNRWLIRRGRGHAVVHAHHHHGGA